jgi:hypothetical protein
MRAQHFVDKAFGVMAINNPFFVQDLELPRTPVPDEISRARSSGFFVVLPILN